MTPLFSKLNLKDQTEIVVLGAPESFEKELAALNGVSIRREAGNLKAVSFVLAFVTTQDEVSKITRTIVGKISGDGLLWFAYPKGTSKKYRCEFNRDTGWASVGESGFEPVRMVAIDEDWSALRFRRVEFIKSLRRDASRAITREGKAKTAKSKTQRA